MENILSPIIQFGFAGFCGVLLVILVWLTKRLLGLLVTNNEVITANTHAIQSVDERTADEVRLLRDVNDKLLSRPCLIEK